MEVILNVSMLYSVISRRFIYSTVNILKALVQLYINTLWKLAHFFAKNLVSTLPYHIIMHVLYLQINQFLVLYFCK